MEARATVHLTTAKARIVDQCLSAGEGRNAAHRAGFLCPAEVKMARMRSRDDGFREARVTYRGFKARGTSKPINGDMDRPYDGERLAIAKAVRNLQAKILKHVGFKKSQDKKPKMYNCTFGAPSDYMMFSKLFGTLA